MAITGSDNPLLAGNAGLSADANIDFPDPFLDIASLVMPRSLLDILNLCESIWLKNGTYRMATSRVVRYFITKVEYSGIDSKQKTKLDTFMSDRFHVNEQLMLIGDDYLGYGNSFSSVVLPFRRFLVCNQCKLLRPIEKTDWKFKEWKFVARCPRCRKDQPHTHVDRRSTEENKIRLKRWAPQEMRLLWHPYSQDYEYYWRMPQDFQDQLKKGNPFFVRYAPWEMIDAVKKNQLFKFNDGVVYHMCEKTLSGVRTGGWGISRLLSNFAQAWYTQVLKRSNEAIAQDYVVPFRVLTPAARGSTNQADPLLHLNIPQFVSKVLEMVRQHRKDPATWHALPFPLNYQALGGEAKSLATPELIDQAMDELLNGLGVPAELYRGTLQFQAMPTALRLFQQTWPHLIAEFNAWLDWMTEIVCTAQSWDKPEKSGLQPVTMADDIEKRQIWLQLASANMISRGTAFAPWGIDAHGETEKIMREQREFDELQREYAEDQDQRAQASEYIRSGMSPQQPLPPGAAAPPGMPPAAMGAGTMGGAMSMTPQDMMGQAQATAQQLAGMPYEARRTELVNLKHQNQAMHALVKQELENIRSAAGSQGQQMLLQGGGMM
jgi:hypothetical protein